MLTRVFKGVEATGRRQELFLAMSTNHSLAHLRLKGETRCETSDQVAASIAVQCAMVYLGA